MGHEKVTTEAEAVLHERQLTGRFQAQAQTHDESPATLSHADVAAASRRPTQRRRRLVAGGVTVGVRVARGPQSSATELPAGAARTVCTASGVSSTVSACSGVPADRLDAAAQALAARF